jgi:hypothetical protein
MPIHRFVTERAELRRAHWETVDPSPLADGQARFRIDSFALTANNITYAAFGEAMSYWAFFPTGDAATGLVPVWGFATVAESRCAGLDVGERIYGYWPIASEVTLQPAKLGTSGFVDATEHRRALPPVYNRYRRCAGDPGYDAAREAEQALLQPLFSTAFLIDDFLDDNAFFGASEVLISSASSKTAYATAFCLQRHGDAVRRIGLTSASNLAFTRDLGCYDNVIEYAGIDTLEVTRGAVYVDFNGSAAVRAAVHGRFGERLMHSASIGAADWSGLGSNKGLPGPKPTLFFAPARIEKRIADWGGAELNARIARTWAAFVQRVSDPARPWMTVVRGRGPEAIAAAYSALVEGRSNPREGHMLSLG